MEEPGIKRERLWLKGDVPNPINPPSGCRVRTRGPYARERCAQEVHELRSNQGHSVACHFWEDIPAPASLAGGAVFDENGGRQQCGESPDCSGPRAADLCEVHVLVRGRRLMEPDFLYSALTELSRRRPSRINR